MMRNFPAFVLAAAACCLASCAARASERPTTRPVVVVELFTSEGCSSCPPADRVLADLAKPDAVEGVDVVALGMHVDYWNSLGWSDPFSSAQFSRRQQAYASAFNSDQIYTPQMIVDGSRQFVGSDRQTALTSIAQAAKASKTPITLAIGPVSKEGDSVSCQIAIDALPHGHALDVMLAVTEGELTSKVSRGENGGRELHHTAVVRVLKSLAAIKGDDPSPFKASPTVTLDRAWKTDHLKLVVFVQDRETKKIVAAASGAMP